MEIEGYIINEKNEPVCSGNIWLEDYSGLNKTPATPITNCSFYAFTDQDINGVYIVFDFPGYKKKKALFNSFPSDSNGRRYVVLEKAFPIAAVLLVVGAVAIYQKQNGKVGKLDIKDIEAIAIIIGGLIALSLIKKILESLGIWDSKDTTQLDAAATDPNSFWNPNYWQTIKPASANWTYAIDRATAESWAKEIWDAAGAFNDCESCMIAVMKRCKTRANASYLAYVFQQIYGADLLTWLRGGTWPNDRLSDADVNTINNYILSLPKY